MRIGNWLSSSDVISLEWQLREYYSGMRTQMRLAHQAYYQKLPHGMPGLPQNFPVHIPSTAPAVVDHFKDQIRTGLARVEVPARGRGPTGRGKRQEMQNLHSHNLEMLQDYLDYDLWREGAFNLPFRGAHAYHVWCRLDAKEGDEDYDWPFDVIPKDPMDIMPAPGWTHPMPYCIEVQERTVAAVIADYPTWSDPKGRDLPPRQRNNLNRLTHMTFFWSPTQYMILADGIIVRNEENPYREPGAEHGVVPYIWMWSGLGRHDESGDPKYLATGILTAAISEIQAEIRLRTALDIYWQFTSGPRLMGEEQLETIQKKWDASPYGVFSE